MRHDRYSRSTPLTPKERASLLNRMERASSPATKNQRRADDRVRYRVSELRVTIAHQEGGGAKFLVVTRNISRGGLSFIHRGFLYNGSRIHATLKTIDGEEMAVLGTVTSCRHIEGTMHEIGVRFDEKIDLKQFAQPQDITAAARSKPGAADAELRGEVLCFTDLCVEAKLIVHHLRALGLSPVMADCVGAAADQATRHSFNVFIADMDSDEGAAAVDAAIKAGHMGPVLFLTAESNSTTLLGTAASSHTTLRKPYTVEQLRAMLERLLPAGDEASPQTIISELQGDKGMMELIVQYIDQVNQTARQLKEAADAEQLDQVRTACQMLKGTASGYGFPQLTEAAVDAVRALDAAESVKGASDKLERVLSIAARLRAS